MNETTETVAEGRVLVRRVGPALYVTLSNPRKRNALSWAMYDRLVDVCEQVIVEPDLRCMVVRGEGGRSFAAGTDITGFVEFADGDDGVAYEHRVGEVLARLAAVPCPVIAVVEGSAVGAGLAIAAMCDLILATPDATFGAPIARTLGNCLPPAVIAALHARLGEARTTAMLMTSSLIDADTAATAGFVHEVVVRDDLEQRVDQLVEQVASAAPLTLAGLKEIGRRMRAVDATVDADDVLRQCYGSRDFREGVIAFLAKRPPQWEGR